MESLGEGNLVTSFYDDLQVRAQHGSMYKIRSHPFARIVRAAMLIFLLESGSGQAGPPFLTDDPEPVEYQKWEINNYVSSVFAKGASYSAIPASDINYGIHPDVQAHVNVALAASSTSGAGKDYGPADFELGVKYRFLDNKAENWWPQLAIYPLLDLPTGDPSRGLGTGRVHAFLPVWAQKDFGKWTIYGGGGYWINPGPGNRDYWFTGGVLLYQLTKSLQLGAELYHETPSSTNAPGTPGYPIGTRDTTGFNLGGAYDLDKAYHVLFSAGRALENPVASNEFSLYVALRLTF